MMPSSPLEPNLLAPALGFVISFCVALRVKRAARLDHPDHRSSHSKPTPTGGGLGITITMVLAFTWLACTGHTQFIGAAFSVLLLGTISWVDDTTPLSPKLRLIAHAVAASAATIPLLTAQGIHALLWPFVIVATIWGINLYNFMDGTDGIASLQGLIYVVGALWFIFPPLSTEGLLLLALGGAILGFLLLNWPPAKVFMGDVGSTALGLTICILASTNMEHPNLIAASLILLSGFITDASYTLLTRLATGQKITEAHRLHCYQKMAQKHQSHTAPLKAYLLSGLLVQWPLAYAAANSEGWYWFIYLAAAITMHGLLCWHHEAGVETNRTSSVKGPHC